ncbi:unnamed protein product [Paramecium primaurelia]|uniref:Uncharacterized protein n=1 Tax=Paramecium primaurelia TaxID=5886 RepID=A0A8S1N8S6_PARPR|nr:unnamed protein product [Paramecium primaurelia]
MISFYVEVSFEEISKQWKALKIFTFAESLGRVKSIINKLLYLNQIFNYSITYIGLIEVYQIEQKL